MGKHRLEPPQRVRPRLGRMAAATVSLVVTGVALLGGIGVIPLGGPGSAASRSDLAATSGLLQGTADTSVAPRTRATPKARTTPSAPKPTPTATPRSTPAGTSADTAVALPASTGSGRRVVFSISDQRVWLVNAEGTPISTYLVSGSVTDNLKPGRYDVFSRSRWAVGIDDSGVMQYFVRFAHGDNAAIGFHSIPTKQGKPLQTEAQLGTPQSHGCIRQKTSDAERMWGFAPVGTDVVVVA
ncbi:MAG: murein L,D-transpeptidase [Marmoricola sp.]|nr:murein L,D-transpeptidase [Marmoricola sp.]